MVFLLTLSSIHSLMAILRCIAGAGQRMFQAQVQSIVLQVPAPQVLQALQAQALSDIAHQAQALQVPKAVQVVPQAHPNQVRAVLQVPLRVVRVACRVILLQAILLQVVQSLQIAHPVARQVAKVALRVVLSVLRAVAVPVAFQVARQAA